MSDSRFSAAAGSILGLKEASDAHLDGDFQDTNECPNHSNCKTVMCRDFDLVHKVWEKKWNEI